MYDKIREHVIDRTLAEEFEKYMKKYPELYNYLASIVKRNVLRKTKKPIIIDLGIGPGLLSQKIFEKIPDAIIIGIDPSKEMLNIVNPG